MTRPKAPATDHGFTASPAGCRPGIAVAGLLLVVPGWVRVRRRLPVACSRLRLTVSPPGRLQRRAAGGRLGIAGPAAAAGQTPGGHRHAAEQTVTDALSRLAANPKPATAQVTEALTAPAFPPAALEVSASRTPTGLEADAIEAACCQGRDCVIGQIRDGSVTVTVLPVLASGKCFVGAA